MIYLHLTIIFVLLIFSANQVEANKSKILQNYGKIPLAFTINKGQYDSQVKFTTRGSGCSMFFTQEGTTFLISRETEESVSKRAIRESVVYLGNPSDLMNNSAEYENFALKVKFLNANTEPEVIGEDLLPRKSNYFIGNDSSEWQTDVTNYKKIRLRNLYDGIDLVYYGNNSSVKYDFIVQPGEDFSRILLTYDLGENAHDGALSVNENGEMVVSTPIGDIIERAPYCYQLIAGIKVGVDIKYMIVESEMNIFSFQVGDYDPEYSLVIDPELAYSTFIGGSGPEVAYGIVVDDLGNAYITGCTNSIDFPETQGTYSGGYGDVFVTKLNSSGTSLVYSTYIGGYRRDDGKDIAIDELGSVYITGWTRSPNFPTTDGAFDTHHNREQDVFVTKLNAEGTLQYSTFLGSRSNEGPSSIVVDKNGCAYVTGTANSSSFPTTEGAWDRVASKGDAFVTKLNATGSDLVYSTFLGGGTRDLGFDIAINENGCAYIAGSTLGDFPITDDAYCKEHSGGWRDGFIAKLSTDGSSLEYSTYIGGSGSDGVYNIVIEENNIYVLGSTSSPDFPTTPDAYDTEYSYWDCFVTKLNAAGTKLLYSTYLGSGTIGGANNLAIDKKGCAFIAGSTYSLDFPTTPDAYDPDSNGLYDVYVAKLNSSGSDLEYSTYFGGSDRDEVYGIAFQEGKVYFAGYTWSPDFPTLNAYDTEIGGPGDVFLSILTFEPESVKVFLDIKPTSCPNPLNVNSNGVLPAAILGTEDFDVTNIDIGTIKLEGVELLRSNIEDVSTPASEDNDCDCTTEGSDGYDDLTTKFDSQDIVEAIVETFGEVDDGEILTLTITGNLINGTPIEGKDCVILKVKGSKGKGIKKEVAALVPDSFSLKQNSPNPFNPITTIEYTIPSGKSENVSLKVYDIRGTLVRTLVDNISSSGVHFVNWDGTDDYGNKVSSGSYIYRLKAGEFTKSNKMLFVR
ncbi:SBBP repeat-containing protein [Candidatus Latescibacterota bacterium]